MRFDELNESNYLLFAIKFYDNPQAVTKDDFESDLKRIRYVKRLLKRYKNSGELKVLRKLNFERKTALQAKRRITCNIMFSAKE